jgi:tetratricopeptide (TPR) repeat protein
LRISTLDRHARSSCRLSLTACDAFAEQYEQALRRIARENEAGLDGAQRAVLYNLEAYCLARGERDLMRALDRVDQAIALRPSIPGFHHTRGVVLLALGRLDESGRELEATWSQGNTSELLEAERCFDLGRLWAARGHADYARDYFERASRARPGSLWSERAHAQLQEGDEEGRLEIERRAPLEGLL